MTVDAKRPSTPRSEALVAIAARVSSVGFNAVTILVLASIVSPAEQGYFFTFLSLISLAALADIGLTTVLQQFIAHERALVPALSAISEATDEPSLKRLRSLLRASVRWYAGVALATAVMLVIGGYAFLGLQPASGLTWQGPWILAGLCAAFDLLALPLLAVMMGLGHVTTAYTVRLIKVGVNALILWGGLYAGLGLWIIGPAILASSIAVWGASLFRFGPLLRTLLREPGSGGAGIDWKREVLPMQWRVAVSWLAGYFVFAAMTPIAFQVSGPVVAGQAGATFALVQAVMMLGHAVIESQLPRMGALVAQDDRRRLDFVAVRTGVAAVGVSFGASVGGMGLLLLARYFDLEFVHRLFPLPVVALFLVGATLQTAVTLIASYFRAHRTERFTGLSVVTAMCMAPAVAVGCALASGYGMAWAFLLITAGVAFPGAVVLMLKFQRERRIVERRALS